MPGSWLMPNKCQFFIWLFLIDLFIQQVFTEHSQSDTHFLDIEEKAMKQTKKKKSLKELISRTEGG